MNTVQRIAKNTAVLFFSQIISYILGFFYVMYTARYLGAEGFGILSFALAFTGIFGVFSDLGLQQLTVREIARDKSLAGKYLGNIAVMKIILVAVTFGLIAITINALGYPEQTIKVVYLVALSVIFGAFSGMFNSIFQAYEKMEYVSAGRILNSALMLAGALFAISQRFGVVGFASIYFLVSVVVLGYGSAVCVWKFVFPKIEVDLGFWKQTIREALPFGVSTVFALIYIYIDSVMLSIMKGDIVVGWYNVAYRLILVLSFIPSIYLMSVFPIISRFYKTSEKSLRFSYERSFKYMMMLAIPIGIGTVLLADKIVLLIFGLDYAPSIVALRILIWSEVFVFISLTCAYLLRSINKQTEDAKATGLGAVLNVILNFLLIPKYGYVGAGFTTVFTEFCVLLILLKIASRSGYKISDRILLVDLSKFAISSLIVGVFIAYFKSINLLVLIFSSVLIYFVLLFSMNTFDKKDISLFKSLIMNPINSNDRRDF